MSEQEQIKELYQRMYDAMVAKDQKVLEELHDDDFVLVHMTGMHQSQNEYIQAIMNGTLNYYHGKHESMTVSVHGDKASLVGQSRVNAAVFGGGKHTWLLCLEITWIKRGSGWKIYKATASTY